ncbi:phage major capsid protein [Dysgonomonas sp. BGC7]|uniref:phage major capsid protein n=1 Tax=Dysgonomonas sp. BGC7 TaxID=1658008 RepID=UPI00068249D9|nr:phage major capsid protein [Dysgonomonas sp. BGC7]MBD8389657.1 phage major capsid protein [Dysgonomonas sp. BGC7]
MKEIFKKAKQNSLYGRRCSRLLKMKGFAIIMLLFVGILYAGSAFSSDNTISKVGGTVMGVAMAAPLAFVVPKELGLSENEEKGLESLAKHLGDQLDQHQKGLLDGPELNEKVKKAFEHFVEDYGINKDTLGKLEKALKDQGLEIKKIKDKGSPSGETFKKQLTDFLGSDSFKSQMKAGKAEGMEIKAAAVITTANATNAPHALSYEVVPGIQESPFEQPVILTTLLKGMTSSRTIIWINRINKEGGAAFIAEGTLKPLMDWEYDEESSTAKKIAVSTKVSTEMLQDFEYMESEIRLLLNRDLYQVLDNKLLNGTGGTTDPAGIITNAGGYIGTGLDGKIFMANNADAIRAAMLQMRLLNYKPNVVFLNPTDSAVMDLTKSTTGNYIKIELEGILRSLRIIETTEIPAGNFLLMDTAKWMVRVYEDFRLEFGWENDDFRKNLVTVIAEMRLHSYQNSIDAGSVIYESFATVKTAIDAPSDAA